MIGRRHARLIEPSGLSAEQYNVLRILRGSAPEGLPTLEIASRMIQQTPGITRLLDKLEAKRLVKRERCPKDRRQVLCWITPAALALLAGIDAPLGRSEEESFEGLKTAEVRQLIDLLGRVREHLEQL